MWGKAVRLHEALLKAQVPHAFGGALALAYYAEPRPTADIDVNVFVPPADWPTLRETLVPLGVGGGPENAADDQLKLPWDGLELHLFFSSDDLHEAMAAATREVPLGGAVVPIVAPEHLVVRKAILDRDKDWADIEAIAAGGERLDRGEIESWMERLLSPRDARFIRLAELTGI